MESNTTISKRDRTRELILDRALALFQKKGYEGTTMRMIADTCGLSLGAAYYHFQNKDALVLAFYERGADEARDAAARAYAETRDFKARLRAVLEARLVQLAPYRNLVGVLARQAVDLGNPLSPFGAATRGIREEAIDLMDAAVQGSNLKPASALRPHLGKLLWMLQLGIVLYWANDRSAGQVRTRDLIERSLAVVVPLLKSSSMPFMGGIVKAGVQVIGVAEACLEPQQKEIPS